MDSHNDRNSGKPGGANDSSRLRQILRSAGKVDKYSYRFGARPQAPTLAPSRYCRGSSASRNRIS
jgi:hypothetical protein